MRGWTLDRTISHNFDGAVDFVKMDLEGEEWAIFAEPSWAPRVRHLLVELHPAGNLPDDDGVLVRLAVLMLELAGFKAEQHPGHPRAVWAWT